MELLASFDSRAKLLNLFYVLAFFCLGTYFLFIWLRSDSSFLATSIQILLIIVMYISAYRFANKAVKSDRLFIGSKTIEIARQGLVISKIESYTISEISNFRHLQKPKITDLPLKGQAFDYLGFNTY